MLLGQFAEQRRAITTISPSQKKFKYLLGLNKKKFKTGNRTVKGICPAKVQIV